MVNVGTIDMNATDAMSKLLQQYRTNQKSIKDTRELQIESSQLQMDQSEFQLIQEREEGLAEFESPDKMTLFSGE